MQRPGSMKNSISAAGMAHPLRVGPASRAGPRPPRYRSARGIYVGGSLLWFEALRVLRFLGLPNANRADLVFRDLRDRVLGGDGHQVDAPGPGPVVRHEYRVRADRRHH